jgi:hypothetical protein
MPAARAALADSGRQTRSVSVMTHSRSLWGDPGVRAPGPGFARVLRSITRFEVAARPGSKRQHAVLAIKRLGGSLLVDVELGGIRGRVQVQADDAGCLGLEARILGTVCRPTAWTAPPIGSGRWRAPAIVHAHVHDNGRSGLPCCLAQAYRCTRLRKQGSSGCRRAQGDPGHVCIRGHPGVLGTMRAAYRRRCRASTCVQQLGKLHQLSGRCR